MAYNTNQNMKVVVTLILLIAFLFTVIEATTIIEVNNTNNGSLTAIDPSKLSFKFAVSWPLGFCITNDDCERKPADLPKMFTIHGLWPKYNGKCVNSTEEYDFKKLASIYGDLKEYWPNIMKNSRPEKFWGEEWDKHGILCNLFTMPTYFSVTLRLYKQVKTGLNILREEPLKTTVDSIRNLKAFEGKRPFVLCKEVSVEGKRANYLQELRFCINGNRQFINCEPQTLQNQYCSKQFKYSATLRKSFLGRVDQDFRGAVAA